MSEGELHEHLRRFPGAALELSADGIVRASNGHLEALTGQQLIGTDLRSVLDESSREKWDRVLRADRTEPPCSWELVFSTPSSLELRRFLPIWGGGEPAVVLWLLEFNVDAQLGTLYNELSEMHRELIDAQRKVGREKKRLALALERAERASRIREDVVAIVSHDLRNPVSTIAMAASVLEMDVPEEAKAEHIAVIKRAAAGMNRLIVDLLDVSAIEAGRFAVDPEPMSMAPLLQEVCRMLTGQATVKRLELQCTVTDELPAVRADRDRVTQVLSNLIGNAIKFTPTGGSIVTEGEVQGADVIITVRDTGPGIPEEDLERIFDRFWHTRRRRGGGAGLGLAIAKGIVEAHGGRIWVESRVGEGTRFRFSLPPARPLSSAGPGR